MVVQSTDRTTQRTYKVELRVHREPSDSVTWTRSTASAWNAQQFVRTSATQWTAGALRFDLTGVTPRVEVNGVWKADSVAAADAAEFPTAERAVCVQRAKTDSTLTEITLYGLLNNSPRVWKRYVDAPTVHPLRLGTPAPRARNGLCRPCAHTARAPGLRRRFAPCRTQQRRKTYPAFSPDRGLTWREHTLLTLPR